MIYERELRVLDGEPIKDIYGKEFMNFGEYYKTHYGEHRLVNVQKVHTSGKFTTSSYLYTFWIEIAE